MHKWRLVNIVNQVHFFGRTLSEVNDNATLSVMKVFNGWLVKTELLVSESKGSITFMLDPQHEQEWDYVDDTFKVRTAKKPKEPQPQIDDFGKRN